MTTTPPTRIGKTTVAPCAGSSYARVRHDDPAVAIDADTTFGRLGARAAPRRIKLLHETPSTSSDWTARQPHAPGWLECGAAVASGVPFAAAVAAAAARITALGLTFKSDTADTRDSPALAVSARLAVEGAQVCSYDPALESIDPAVLASANVTAVDDPYRAAKAADAIVVLTEWPEFGGLDLSAIADQAPGAS